MKWSQSISLILFTSQLIFFSCTWNQEQKEPSTYLIPESIRGEIIIIHDFKKGEKSTVLEGKRQYHIPENGILYSRAPLTYGVANDDFYLVDENGTKKAIVIEVNTKDDHEICVYNSTTGKITIENVEYPYEAYMICRKDSIAYYYDYKLDLDKSSKTN